MAVTLTVGANTWVTLQAASKYINQSVNADIWYSFTQDMQERSLVAAFRLLDRVNWAGERTDPNQPSSWPRRNVVINGVAVDENTIPDHIINAQIEYAVLIAQDATLTSASTGDPTAGTKVLQAGSARIEFFNNNPNTRIASSRRFPLAVHELIAPCLAGVGSDILGGTVSGNDDCSQFTGRRSELFRGFG